METSIFGDDPKMTAIDEYCYFHEKTPYRLSL